MGLTSIRALTYYWVSQLGMLAGTLAFVNAGTQLARIDSVSGILSPAVLVSFAGLGILPLAGKKALAAIKARKLYKRWRKPAAFDYNGRAGRTANRRGLVFTLPAGQPDCEGLRRTRPAATREKRAGFPCAL